MAIMDSTSGQTRRDYSVEELRDYLKQIREETGKDIRVILPKRAADREAAADARLLAGVETSATQSMEGFQSKLERSRSRPGATP